jgi:hypothetical protein
MAVNDHVIHMENGILHADSPRSKIDMMISSALAQQAAGPLVVHFHGGLVSFNTGKDGATRLLPIYQQAGGYPVFFVWESGLIETIKNNLGEVSKENIFRIIWKRIRKTIERKLIQVEDGRDLGDLPQPADDSFETEIDDALAAGDVTELMKKDLEGKERLTELSAEEFAQIEAELEYDFDLSTEVENISNALRDPNDIESELNSRSFTVWGSTSTLMDPVALNQVVVRPDPASRGLISMAKMIKDIVKITAKGISRFVHGRDHGLHATIVEQILHELYVGNVGGIVWKTMKKDTADSFGPDPQVHGGTAFLDSLKNQADSNNPPRVVLIGHSTGAVYISEFLKHADNVLPVNFKFDVVYLAPASTFRLTSETFGQFKHRISEFRMFAMTDENEKKDRLVPVIYPYSLLYFVSGVVETEVDIPIIGMERFYDTKNFSLSKFPAISVVRNYVDTVPNCAIWSVTSNAGAGLNSASISHGDFDDEQTTLASVSHIIANGY